MTSFATRISVLNRRVHESGFVPGFGPASSALHPCERNLLARLEETLPNMRMLDIGVGGGRTSIHFAHRVKSYLGVDRSAEMIEACRDRFPDPPANIRFALGDARSLKGSAPASFDLILFSDNGLDGLGHEDRHRVLEEMLRLLAPGGWLGFSSHNLMSVGLPGRGVRARYRRLRLRLLNGNLGALRRGSYAVIRDKPFHRQGEFHVRPSEQAVQLRSLGLVDVKISAMDGREVDSADPDAAGDAWLYYLARLP